jgi:hypothetical protein
MTSELARLCSFLWVGISIVLPWARTAGGFEGRQDMGEKVWQITQNRFNRGLAAL